MLNLDLDTGRYTEDDRPVNKVRLVGQPTGLYVCRGCERRGASELAIVKRGQVCKDCADIEEGAY